MKASSCLEKKTAIVLGGTSPHISLVQKMKERGYYTILIDYLNNSPAIPFADEHIRESTLDCEKVLEIAKDKKAEVVISTCIDQANSTCCYVAEKLGLAKPYDYQTSLNVTDKGLMKEIMVRNEIPTSPYFVTDSDKDIPWEKVQFPAVVKPVDCNSSKGVHRADTKEEVIRYVKEDIAMSRTGKAIVEGFNEGFEIQVDCLALYNRTEVLMTRQKKKITDTDGIVLQSTGSLIPADLSEKEVIQSQQIAKRIADAFGLKNTPFFYQAIVTDQGIQVLEFAPRIGGGLSTYLLKLMTGVDIIDAAIQSFLGEEIQYEKKSDSQFCSSNLIYMNAGIFDHLEGFRELKEDHTITEYFCLKQKGTEIDKDLRSGNRVAAFVVQADSPEELKKKEQIAYQSIRIINQNGEDAINRSISYGIE